MFRLSKQWRPLAIAIPLAVVVAVSYLLSFSDTESVNVRVFTPSIVESESGVSVSIERISIVPAYSINRPSSLDQPAQAASPDEVADDRHALIEGRFFNSANSIVLMRNMAEADRHLFRSDVGGAATVTIQEGFQLDVEPRVQTSVCDNAPGWFEILPGASVDYSIRLTVRSGSAEPAGRNELSPPNNKDLIENLAIDQLEAGRLLSISFPPFLFAGCDSATGGKAHRIDIKLTDISPPIEMTYYPYGPPECSRTEDPRQSAIWLPPGESLARDLAEARGCLAGQ